MDLQYTQITGFSEIETPAAMKLLDNESDTDRVKRLEWDHYYATTDYYRHHTWEAIKVWLTGDREHCAVAEIQIGDREEIIWFPQRADLAHYWHQFGSARLAQFSSQFFELFEMATKMFQATHGHDNSDICRSCDPFAWRRQEKWDRIRALATSQGWSGRDESLRDYMKRMGMSEADYDF